MSAIASHQEVDDVKARAAAEHTSLEDLYADAPSSPASGARSAPAPEQAAEPEGDAGEEPVEAAKADKAPRKSKADDDDDHLPEDVVGLRSALTATRAKARENREKAKELEQRLEAEAQRRAAIDTEARRMWERLREFEGRGQPQGQQPPQQANPMQDAPDPVLDPKGYQAWTKQILQQELESRDAERNAAFQQQLYETRFNQDRARVMSQVEDVEDFTKAEHEFAAAAQQDPQLWQALRQHPYPAEFAYQVVQNMRQVQEMQQAGGLQAYIQSKVKAELEKAQASRQAQQPSAPQVPTVPTRRSPPPTPPPQSLARTPSVAPRSTGRTYEGPTPLTDLYDS